MNCFSRVGSFGTWQRRADGFHALGSNRFSPAHVYEPAQWPKCFGMPSGRRFPSLRPRGAKLWPRPPTAPPSWLAVRLREPGNGGRPAITRFFAGRFHPRIPLELAYQPQFGYRSIAGNPCGSARGSNALPISRSAIGGFGAGRTLEQRLPRGPHETFVAPRHGWAGAARHPGPPKRYDLQLRFRCDRYSATSGQLAFLFKRESGSAQRTLDEESMGESSNHLTTRTAANDPVSTIAPELGKDPHLELWFVHFRTRAFSLR